MGNLWPLIVGGTLAIFIVLGNGLVIFLITTRRNLRTTTNWFVLSLAVADFGVGAVHFPRLSFCSIRDETCLNEGVKIAYTVGSLFVYASAANLCALTLDRYIAIVHPLRYVTFMAKKRVALVVSAAWGLAGSVSAFRALPLIDWSELRSQQLARVILGYYATLGIFTVSFLLFATVRIFLVVRRITKHNAAVVAQLNFNHKLQHGVSFKTRETASAKMIGIVVTVCLVYYLFYVTRSILEIAGEAYRELLQEIGNILILINSLANPVVYAFHKEEMKKEVKRLLTWRKTQRVVHDNSPRGR